MGTLLSVRDHAAFGASSRSDGVSFDVEQGQVAGLIGPNGAGKTTAFNVITRLYTPDEGELELEGTSLLRTPPNQVRARHRPYVPEHQPVHDDVGARQRSRRRPPPRACDR
jgi:ABC-type branched-subunit amino acid transport system ATPase component